MANTNEPQKPRACGVFVLGKGGRVRANRDRPQGARLAQNTLVGAYSLGARGVATGTVPFARRRVVCLSLLHGGWAPLLFPCTANATAFPNPHCVVQTGTVPAARARAFCHWNLHVYPRFGGHLGDSPLCTPRLLFANARWRRFIPGTELLSN